MDIQWQEEFRNRMQGFGRRHAPATGDIPLSIKIRVTSGCYHREHSPHAYELIDAALAHSIKSEFDFEEHESGPELLVYMALATAGVTLAKSVIDLITAIIKARSDGVKKGDQPNDPLELIVRRVDDQSGFREETVLRIGNNQPADQVLIEKKVEEALAKLLSTEAAKPKALPSAKVPKRKKK